jgi:hypothetical protein
MVTKGPHPGPQVQSPLTRQNVDLGQHTATTTFIALRDAYPPLTAPRSILLRYERHH